MMRARPDVQLRPASAPMAPASPGLWELNSMSDLAVYFRSSRAWIFKLYKAGLLKGRVLGRPPGAARGGRLLFRREDVLEFLGERP